MKFSKSILNALLFTCLGILLMLFYYMLYNQLNYLNKSSDQVIHTALVKLKLEQTLSNLKDAETGQWGYLITHDSVFLEPYFQANSKYEKNLSDLDSLNADNTNQKKNLEVLNDIVRKRLAALNTSLFLGSKQKQKDSLLTPLLLDGKKLMDSIRLQMTVMSNLEDSILTQHQVEKAHRTQIAPIWAFIFFAFALFILLISFYRIRVDLQKQRLLKEEILESNRLLANQKAFAELLVGSSPDQILAMDKDFYVIEWNKKSEEHFGISKNELLGKQIYDFLPEYKGDAWQNIVKEVLKGNPLHLSRVKFVHKQGYGELFVIPLKFSDGEVFVMLCITRDITTLVETTNALQEKNEELQRSNKELASFSYVASHDLQEPLRKIQGFINRILEKEGEKFSETSRDYFNRINSAAFRMQNLIDALLNFSHTNTSEIVFKETNLNDLLVEVKLNLKENIDEKKAVIEASHLSTIPVIPVQFQQLLSNLISNALKYSKPGVQPHIRIHEEVTTGAELQLADRNASHKFLKIIVEDNGIGFEQKYATRIFELFQRLHGKTEYSGTGIGLAICKKIVQNHNGYITATGVPGEGAKFEIYIPIQSSAA